MPRISEFYGIVITMFYDDHAPPHFHARYAEHQAKVLIATGEIFVGDLPRPAVRRVRTWAELRRDELEIDWRRARDDQPLNPIEPLP